MARHQFVCCAGPAGDRLGALRGADVVRVIGARRREHLGGALALSLDAHIEAAVSPTSTGGACNDATQFAHLDSEAHAQHARCGVCPALADVAASLACTRLG